MNTRLLIVCLTLLFIVNPKVSSQTSMPQNDEKKKRLEWWQDARFGMMIHWGAYAEAGGYWKGEYEGGYSEWLKFRGIPNVEYDSLVHAFNPADFDATKWVNIAKAAGMKYMVFTAKHHDGFAMYDSEVSDYDIVDQTSFGRDPVRELAEACQKARIKFGVYYSVDRDWHHPDAACDDHYQQCNFWDYPENKSGRMDSWHNSYFKNYAVKQVTELVSQYPIDILWFDGIGLKTPEEVALLDSIIHSHRPNCLINSRIGSFVNSQAGDYGSKGDNETPGGYQPGGWENPGTLGFSYGYSERDSFMSSQQAIHNLIEIVSKGGNYLLNVGPNGKGIIPPKAVAILEDMGVWLKEFGSSIYGADGMPYEPPATIRLTRKPHQLFVHVLDSKTKKVELPSMNILIPEYLESVQWVYRLADLTKMPLKFEATDGILSIDLTSNPNFAHPMNPYAEVLVVSDQIQPQVLSLWNGKAPLGDGSYSEEDPIITLHRPTKSNGTAVVICPGGGYGYLVKGPEGHMIADWLNEQGIAGIVLEYRLPKGNHRVPLMDAQQALRLVRYHAQEWGIDPNRIGIMGFSVGGHLASTAATHFDKGQKKANDPVARLSCRPDFGMLIYPVVSMGSQSHPGSRNNLLGPNPSDKLIKLYSNELQVTRRTPPIFLAHAQDDALVPPENSQILFDALKAKKIYTQYLELPSGGHGLNGYSGPMWEKWKANSLEWLREIGMGR